MIFSMIIAKGQTAILSTMLFVVWIIMGILIYLSYGYRKNREAEIDETNKRIVEENGKVTSNI